VPVPGARAMSSRYSVFPTAPSPAQDRFDFEINGSKFNPPSATNIVNVNGQGDIAFRHSEAPDGCKQYLTNPDPRSRPPRFPASITASSCG